MLKGVTKLRIVGPILFCFSFICYFGEWPLFRIFGPFELPKKLQQGLIAHYPLKIDLKEGKSRIPELLPSKDFSFSRHGLKLYHEKDQFYYLPQNTNLYWGQTLSVGFKLNLLSNKQYQIRRTEGPLHEEIINMIFWAGNPNRLRRPVFFSIYYNTKEQSIIFSSEDIELTTPRIFGYGRKHNQPEALIIVQNDQDKGVTQIFIDGKLAASGTFKPIKRRGTKLILLGNGANNTTGFKGYVQGITFWNRFVKEEEARLFQKHLASFVNPFYDLSNQLISGNQSTIGKFGIGLWMYWGGLCFVEIFLLVWYVRLRCV